MLIQTKKEWFNQDQDCDQSQGYPHSWAVTQQGPTVEIPATDTEESDHEIQDLLEDVPDMLAKANQSLSDLRWDLNHLRQAEEQHEEDSIVVEAGEDIQVQEVQELQDGSLVRQLKRWADSNIELQKTLTNGLNQIYGRLGKF